MMGVDLPKVPKVYEAHRANLTPFEKALELVIVVPRPHDRRDVDGDHQFEIDGDRGVFAVAPCRRRQRHGGDENQETNPETPT